MHWVHSSSSSKEEACLELHALVLPKKKKNHTTFLEFGIEFCYVQTGPQIGFLYLCTLLGGNEASVIHRTVRAEATAVQDSHTLHPLNISHSLNEWP